MNFFLKLFLPLSLLAPGVFSQDVSPAEDNIAPYAYSERVFPDSLGHMRKEELFLRKKIKRASGNALAQSSLAGVLASQSQLTGDLSKMDEAEKFAKRSLENLPYYNFSARMVLAEVAEARHQFPEAIKIAEDVLKESKGNVSALNLLVTAKLGFGKPAEAARDADILITLVPEMTSYTFRALTRLAQGQNAEALSDFQEALKRESAGEKSSSAWLRMLMGRYYFRILDLETAKKYTDSSLKVMPDYHAALAQKGEIAVMMNNDEEAMKLYQKAYKERQEPPYLLAMADIHERRNEHRMAEKIRFKAEKIVRKEIETTPYGHYNELAQILINRGNSEESAQAVEAAQTNVTQRMNGESYFVLAQAFAFQGNIAEAKKAIDTAIATKETNFRWVQFRDNLK